MLSAFFKWLFEHLPTAAAFLVSIIGVIIICYKVFKFYFTRFLKLEKECEKIAIIEKTANLSNDVSNKIEKHIDDKLLPKLDGVVNSINGLLMYLSAKDKNFKSEVYVVKSPVQLSAIGIDILERSNGKKFVDDAKDSLIKEMETQVFKSALDVQNYARIVLFNNVNSDNFVIIKNYIFNNPLYHTKEGASLEINLNIMVDIIAIYLRDKYFEKHPELKDIETTSQNNNS